MAPSPRALNNSDVLLRCCSSVALFFLFLLVLTRQVPPADSTSTTIKLLQTRRFAVVAASAVSRTASPQSLVPKTFCIEMIPFAISCASRAGGQDNDSKHFRSNRFPVAPRSYSRSHARARCCVGAVWPDAHAPGTSTADQQARTRTRQANPAAAAARTIDSAAGSARRAAAARTVDSTAGSASLAADQSARGSAATYPPASVETAIDDACSARDTRPARAGAGSRLDWTEHGEHRAGGIAESFAGHHLA